MSALVGGGAEVNKFEQVSSDGHQMSLAGGAWAVGSLSNEVQYLRAGGPGAMRSNASWLMVTYDTVDRMTDRHDWKHYLPQLRWQAINI